MGRRETRIPLIEGLTYYVEHGRWVFTEQYHLLRGICCGSGCRHCPYRRPEMTVDPREPAGPPGRIEKPNA